MTRARELADQHKTLDVDGGTIKLDGNYPTGTGNVALGDAALDDGSLSGGNNVAIGTDALTANTTGSEGTAVGQGALSANTTGQQNTAVGRKALEVNTSGNYNTAVGQRALDSNTTTSSSTAVGYQALYTLSNGGSGSTAVGWKAGYSYNSSAEVFGSTFIGLGAGTATTGHDNGFFGSQAGYNHTTGNYNTAVGSAALQQNTTASNNTAIGYQAGYSNTTGAQNTYLGQGAGYLVTTGTGNTVVGRYTGNAAGLDIRTSDNNIVLSDGAGNPRVSVNNLGYLGIRNFNPGTTFAVLSDGYNHASQFQVANNGYAGALWYNQSGTVVGQVQINASSTAYITSSDYRLKENLVDLTGAADRVRQLAPKRFNFIEEADTTVDGFLAHEVADIVPEAITGEKDAVDAEGNPVYQGIDQSKLVPLLTAALQEALTKIDDLEARIAALES